MAQQNDTQGAPQDFDANVQITFKRVAPLHIEIDIDALTVGDLDFVEKLSSSDASTTEMVKFLGSVIPGRDISTIPLRAIPQLSEAVLNAIGGASDPNDSAPDSQNTSGQESGNARTNTEAM